MEDYINQVHTGSGDNVYGVKHVYSINIDMPKKVPLELSDIIRKKDAYCKTAFKEYLCLPIIEDEQILDIEKIYVTLALTHDNLSREQVFVDTSGVSFDTLIETVDMHRDLGSPQKMEAGSTISLRSVLFNQKVVILGEPGIGKSTLLKKIFIDVCKKNYFSEFLPVYISLSNVAIKDINFINRYMLQKYKEFEDVLEYYVKVGRTFFLLDGLDEIDYLEQQQVSNVIDHLAAKGNKFFVTCRTTVFQRGLFSSDFKIFECIGFNAAQRRKFLKLWFNDDLDFAIFIENEITNNLGITGISRNPLLLSLIAMHFDKNKSFHLPQKRIFIYLKSIQLLLERREKRNIWNIPISDRISILEYVAYNMNIKNIDVIAEKDLIEFIVKWNIVNPDSVFTQYTTDVVVKQITEADGILYRCSKKHFRFLHLVLQESLAAKYLAQQYNWFEIFKSKMYFPRWEETLRLLVGLVTQNNSQRNIIADYLYKEIHANKDNLFLFGRYISDFDSSEAKKFYPIFNMILEYIQDSHNQCYFTDAIVALTSICNCHTSYREYVISVFRQELKKSYNLLYTYIRLLKLMPSPASRKELIRLMSLFTSGYYKRETSITVIGMLLNALEYYSNFDFWKEIFQKYVNRSNSHLSGIIAKVLSNIQIREMYDFLDKENRMGESYKRSLISYILQKYEDENITRVLVTEAIKRHDICLEQTFSDKYITMDSIDILELVKEEKNELSLAFLLDSVFLFAPKNDSEFLENIIFNSHNSLILRCSALNTYLTSNNNTKKRMIKLISYFKHNQIDTNLHLVCINNLAKHENFSLLSDYFFECENNLEPQVIRSLARVLISTSIEGASLWLLEMLDKYKVGSTDHMYIVLALAKQGYPNIYNYLKSYIFKLPHLNFRERVLLIKALSMGNLDNKIDLLMELLASEVDVNIISLIIEHMGYIQDDKIEEILLLYLNVKNWPSSWPNPFSELQQGEQRPSDRRLVMIILSLNKLGSQNAIPLLEKIYNDTTQADDVRQTAYIAYKNLKWNSNTSVVSLPDI